MLSTMSSLNGRCLTFLVADSRALSYIETHEIIAICVSATFFTCLPDRARSNHDLVRAQSLFLTESVLEKSTYPARVRWELSLSWQLHWEPFSYMFFDLHARVRMSSFFDVRASSFEIWDGARALVLKIWTFSRPCVTPIKCNIELSINFAKKEKAVSWIVSFEI